MKRNILKITVALAVLCLSAVGCTRLDSGRPICVDCYGETIRVACIGDSITFGSSIKNRVRACYPAQLGRML
ncbi:MAG: hypothetical protein ACYSUD_08200, partial [Planctomycetota bacterium]